MLNEDRLRNEKMWYLIGNMVGQMAQLLNYMKLPSANTEFSYDSLFDICKMSALQIHELLYKDEQM